ncbi:MAG: phosphatase PAP2 family protein [Paracoccaceae bacterium]|nr:phosphatase PAP2 family protein [Paracoccaceae bacterium]
MKLFFRLSLFYMAISVAVIVLARHVDFKLIEDAGIATLAFASVMTNAGIWVFSAIAVLSLIKGRRYLIANLGLLTYAVLGSVFFHTAYSFLKSTIPFIVPFYADPKLAAFDRWLHGGTDPWVLTHLWAQFLPVEKLFPAYLSIWSLSAAGLLVIIALADSNQQRIARYLILFFACWVLLGNLMAVAVSSVGPVYYDALLGGNRFAALTAALSEPPFFGSAISKTQGYLWKGYSGSGMALGSGISAFPSVHLAVATTTALYMAERSRWLILPGVLFVAVILYLSVYTGYHYAIDGYFSILVIVGFWVLVMRVQKTTEHWGRDGFRAQARVSMVNS